MSAPDSDLGKGCGGDKYERCVKKVKKKGTGVNPYAVCHASVGKSMEGEGSRGGVVIGHTTSGKPIYQSHSHPAHAGFTVSDHYDAAQAHKKKFNELRGQSGEEADKKREEHRAEFRKHADSVNQGVEGEKKAASKMTFKEAHGKIRDALKQHGWSTTEDLKYNHATSPDGKHRIYFTAQSMHHSHQPEGRGHSMNTAHSIGGYSKEWAAKSPEEIHSRVDRVVRARAGENVDKSFPKPMPARPGIKHFPKIKDKVQQRQERQQKKEAGLLKKAGQGEGSRGGVVIGHTKSGKPIYQYMGEILESTAKSQLRQHFGYAKPKPFSESLSVRGHGEGSRGGIVIGHTKTNKPIYQDAHHAGHRDFSDADHQDAAEAHKAKIWDAIRKRDQETSPEARSYLASKVAYHKEARDHHRRMAGTARKEMQ